MNDSFHELVLYNRLYCYFTTQNSVYYSLTLRYVSGTAQKTIHHFFNRNLIMTTYLKIS
jgi:hypothetical protein